MLSKFGPKARSINLKILFNYSMNNVFNNVIFILYYGSILWYLINI